MVALSAGARFVAQGIDTQQNSLTSIFERAHFHKGTSFVQIFQNCIVYNDGIFNKFTAKDSALDKQIYLEHNKPLTFGADGNKGIYFNPQKLKIEVVVLGENNITIDDILIHDETNKNLASLLSEMDGTEFPIAVGVLFCDPSPSYDQLLGELTKAQNIKTNKDLNLII